MRQARILLAGIALMASPAALACACCGFDDTWRSQSVASESYESEVVQQLMLGAGRFRPYELSHEEEWSIAAVERVGGSFIFESEMGSFRFVPHGPPEHRMVDVTFATQPNYQLDDVADIYHEIVFVGDLAIPDRAAKLLGRTTLESTVVLQGLGNMCMDAGDYRRWLISSWTEHLMLAGSGVMARQDAETEQHSAARASKASRR